MNLAIFCLLSDLEETKEKLDKKRGRKRKTDSAEDQSKKPKIVVERQKLPSGSGVCLTLGQGDTGQLGLGEDIMERSKPALVKSIPVKVSFFGVEKFRPVLMRLATWTDLLLRIPYML